MLPQCSRTSLSGLGNAPKLTRFSLSSVPLIRAAQWLHKAQCVTIIFDTVFQGKVQTLGRL